MKKYLLILLMLVSIFCKAQQKPNQRNTGWAIAVTDSTGMIAYMHDGSDSLHVLDSAATIKILFQSWKDDHDRRYLLEKELELASEVLLYINKSGLVNNRQKYAAAVRAYQAYINNKK